MERVRVRVYRTPGNEDLPLPRYMTEQAAGMDLPAAVPSPVVLPPGEWALIPTGIILELPPGIEGQVRPRSGLALKHGITCLNSPGTIDADYRGEVGVILINHGREPFTVRRGERIAQLVLGRVVQGDLELTLEPIDETERGAGGFGHTGVR